MNILLLGIGIGMLSLLAPGPVNVALMQVGARQGYRPAFRGALGVVSGDSLLGVAAVIVVAVGSTMPATFFAATRLGAALILVTIGLTLLVKPVAVGAAVDRIRRPGRALFLLTSLTPSALGAWIALLAAMPFADDVRQLAVFAGGVLIASYVWHPTLAALSSSLGGRLTDQGQINLSRLGGASTSMLGLGLVGTQLL